MNAAREKIVPLPYVLLAVAALIGAIIFLRVFVIATVYVMSDSMAPTMYTGDRALAVTSLVTRGKLRRGDIVWFKDPRGGREALVKRLMALPGDKIEVAGGQVFVNGVPVAEPYLAEKPEYEFPEFHVPPGYVIVLGDNRNYSDDSRIWGPLPVSNIKGRIIYILWPPSRVRRF